MATFQEDNGFTNKWLPVSFLVEGKEIKRYKNVEIPDDLKKLEYQDFKFDVLLNGTITFKIIFEPGVLPEEFPQTRERRTRKLTLQGAEPQVTAAADMKATPQEVQPAASLPVETVEALAQALEDAHTAGEPVVDIAEAMVDGQAIKAEIIEGETIGRVLVIIAEPESIKATTQPENDIPPKKPAPKGKTKKGAVTTDSANR